MDECSECVLLYEQLVKRYRNGAVQECEWMDKMVFRDIELVNEVSFSLVNHNHSSLIYHINASKLSQHYSSSSLKFSSTSKMSKHLQREKRDSDCMYLLINFPTFKKDNTEYRAVHYQTVSFYRLPRTSRPVNHDLC